VRVKAGHGIRRGSGQPFAVLLHQSGNFHGVRKHDGRTGNAAGQRAVDAADFGLAPKDDAPVKLANRRFLEGRGHCRKLAHPQNGVVMVHGFKVVAQGFSSHRDAVFDKLCRLAQRECVALDGVRRVGQVNIIGFLEGQQRLSRYRAHCVELHFLRRDRS